MDASKLEGLSAKLCDASVKGYLNPYSGMEWPAALAEDEWQFTPEITSLYGTETWEGLSEVEKKKLAFWETVNFFSLNIHGERELIAGLSLRLYKNYPPAVTAYIHHFLDEENKHMLWFGGFCERYAKKTYPEKKMRVSTPQYAVGEEDFLFFAKVMVFELVVDSFNVKMSQDVRLSELSRKINRQHHVDESRHLAFGIELVRTLYRENASQWGASKVSQVADYLAHYLTSTWKEYYNPTVYADAGLEDGYDLRESAWEVPSQKSWRREASAKIGKVFTEIGLWKEDTLENAL